MSLGQPLPGEHGVRCWRVGERVIERARSERSYRQLLTVAELVWPRLPGCPKLLDRDDEARTITRTWHEGQPGAASLGETAERVRALHALPCESPDPMPPLEALVRRRAAAARVLADDLAERALQLDLELLGPLRRCWCHRDLRPDNVLGPGAVLIDWEHARPDVGLMDLARWPELARELGVPDPTYRVVRALHGLQTRAWGLRQGDLRYQHRGQDLLERILA